jgi:putative ABC transport system permease protein
MSSLARELRQALRSLARVPGFSLAAILILALGIGANTAIFSVTRAVLLRPLPFREPSTLAWVWATRVDRDRAFYSIPNFNDTQAAAKGFEELAGWTPWSPTLTGTDEPERLSAVRVTGNAFPILGSAPLVGRLLGLADAESRVAAISHGLWTRRFGSDPAVVGRGVTLNGESYEVVGVLPQDFLFPGAEDAEVAVPISLATDSRRAERGSNFLRVFGRLSPGWDAVRAGAELASITARLAELHPDENAKLTAPRVLPLAEEVVGGSRRLLVLLSASVALLLLVAGANIAALFLVRSLGRRREVSVRKALGAGPVRLVLPFLLEAILLAVAGAAVSVLLAHEAIPALLSLAPASLPRASAARIDGAALALTAALAALCAVASALGPALSAGHAPAAGSLADRTAGGAPSRSRTRLAFVFLQVALSLILLAGAALLSKSFGRLLSVDPGFSAENVLAVRLTLGKATYPDPEAAARFFETVSSRLRELPGVEAAGATSVLPLSGMNARQDFEIVGRPPAKPSEAPGAQARWIDPGYLGTLGIPVTRGRGFAPADDHRAPGVAVIDETLARMLFPAGDAVGSRLRLEDAEEKPREAEIVGVVGGVKHFTLDEKPLGTLYLPLAQIPGNMLSNLLNNSNLVIRTHAAPLATAPAMRRAIREIDPDMATGSIRTMAEVRGGALAAHRFAVFLFGLFAAAASALAAIGLYAAVSQLVAQDQRSIGIRLALGASPGVILRQVASRGLAATLGGIAAGLVAAVPLARLLSASLYEVSPADPSAFLAAAALLLAVSAAACAIPARRAARIDPMSALRSE